MAVDGECSVGEDPADRNSGGGASTDEPSAEKSTIDERQLTGFKHLQRMRALFETLRDEGCRRDRAGNRKLHFDEYCALVLLYFFNPVVGSLRGIQQASLLKKVQRKLGVPRTSLGSLSEATAVFDPERLQGVIQELAKNAPPVVHDGRLSDFPQELRAVDGTLLRGLPMLAKAALHAPRSPDGWRLHTQFEILRGVPARMDLSDGRNKGPSNEKSVLRAHLAADCCYICDRGYEQFSLFNAIRAAGSSYVIRIRGDHHFTPEQNRELSEADRAAGVTSDATGKLGSPKSQRIEHPDHTVRVVRIAVEPHPNRAGAQASEIVLATNLLDVPAEIIALLYRYRWSIELFFRFFKHLLGCRHLLSERPQGIQIQVYCAIVACLLISLTTGRKPSRRTMEMLQFYMLGWADEEELLAHINSLPEHAKDSK